MKRQTRSGGLSNVSTISPGDSIENGGTQPSKKEPKISSLREYLIDYSLNSNLHGVRYMGDGQRTIVEKLFWAFIFIICLVVCCDRIAKIWTKWDENPIIVSLATDFTPIWKIPFPAVTVCAAKKFNYTVFNSSEHNDLYEDVTIICTSPFLDGKKDTLLGNETFQNLKKISNEYMSACSVNDIGILCLDSFQETATEDGICYTFNSLGADEILRLENVNKDYEYLSLPNTFSSWTLDGGYPPNTPLETYPYRGSNYRFGSAGLSLIVTADKTWHDFDYKCRGLQQNYQIFLHNPAELPNLSRVSYKASLSKQTVFVVKPKMMTTSEGLRHYNAERRKCYFQDRYLRFFKAYTQSNCEMECVSNYTMARCGCVHFGFPHGPETPICGKKKWKCMYDARSSLVIAVMPDQDVNKTEATEVALRCKCLPACTTMEYEAELMESDYNFTGLYKALDLDGDFDETSKSFISHLYISFKDSQFITSQRTELYGLTDFLANCGGLLGLFIGFSLLSVVEIFYFSTIRLFLWKDRLTNSSRSS